LKIDRSAIWAECLARGLSNNENLPELEESLSLRPLKEIVGRIMALHGIVACSYGYSPTQTLKWLEENGVVGFLTSSERIALESSGSMAEYQWEVYSLYALAWVLGLINGYSATSEMPDTLVNVLPDIKEGEAIEHFYSRVSLRGEREIIVQLDASYCVHWAILDAAQRGIASPVEGAIQRRRALEWCMSDKDWDSISLDT